MTTISAISPTAPVASSAPVPAVARSNDAFASANAVALVAQADAIASLGGTGAVTGTYNASGLLDTIARAGTVDAGSSAPVSESLDQGLVDNLGGGANLSGLDALAATVGSGDGQDVSANYAKVLQANPSLAADVIARSYDQGIVSTISTSA